MSTVSAHKLAKSAQERLRGSWINATSRASFVHPSAIVAPGAEIGEGSVIGPYCVIGADVVLGKNNTVASHVVIDGYTLIGDQNQIYQFASVGAAPQDKKFHGEPSTLEIGDRNVIREYVTLQPGTEGGDMRTSIGNGNLFMANTHVGHDSHIGDENVFANSSALAGHVSVANKVTVGGLVGIHQFTRVGDLVLLGAGAMVTQDIPPYCMAQGDRARLIGINTIGLQRAGFSEDAIRDCKAIFKRLFMAKGILADEIKAALDEFQESACARKILEFVQSSERGVAALRKNTSED